MPTIEYTEQDLRARIRALEDGLLKVEKGVTFETRGVTYKTADEIIPSLEYFKGLLASMTGLPGATPRRSRLTYGVATKGF